MKTKAKVAIVVNPSAGQRASEVLYKELRQALKGFQIDWCTSGSIEETSSFLKKQKPGSVLATIIAGGDGTLNRLLPALITAKVPVIPYPTGTANDFSRQHGWRADPELLKSSLANASFKKVDVLTVNRIPFATVGGFGIGSELAGHVNNYREKYSWFRLLWKKYKSKAYSFIAIKEIMTSRKFMHKVRIEAPGFMEDIDVSSFFACNQSTLGGNILACDESKPDDGKFEFIVTSANKRYELISSLVKSKTRLGVSNSYVIQTKECKVTSIKGKHIKVFGDGEVILEAPFLKFKVKHHALTLLEPIHAVELIRS